MNTEEPSPPQNLPQDLPLSGIRVIELGHVVLGSSCGLILADMGAEVIKVEKAPDGDDTRRYSGFGSGLFHYFNRNKKSLTINLKEDDGKAVLRKAIQGADVFIENFGPRTVERLGFGYEDCAALNPGLVYCSLKGFMPGPYENRPSLDNLVQMMGGLAYMTGPAGRPLRAGASVTDILAGTFGALGIITALYERRATGKGQNVVASLFESTAYLVAQHMSAAAVTGEDPPPMPEGENPWAIYDLFASADGDQICIGVVSDRHWQQLCEVFEWTDLRRNSEFDTNDGRKQNREYLLEQIQDRLANLSGAEINARCEEAGLPFAPVRKPQDLFEDPHLLNSGGLLDTRLADGRTVKLPRLPLRMGDHEFGMRLQAPAVGEGARDYLAALGYDNTEIDRLVSDHTIVVPED